MAYAATEPCIGAKDTVCVDACPVDSLTSELLEATDEYAVDVAPEARWP